MTLQKYLKGLLTASLAALLLTSVTPAFAATKIMPLGDSITGSPGCWRAYLWEKLTLNNFTNIDMVGTLPAQGCAVAHDGDNEGHGGILALNMANQSQLPPWLSATKPDVVLMHLGTNDVWSSKPTSEILAAFTTLVQQIRASNTAIKIVVAKIIPMDSARSCGSCADGVIALNNALPAWAAGLSTSASPVTIADIWTGFSAISDTYDGVHPTDAGHKKIADAWYPAVVAALNGASSSSAVSSSKSSVASNSSSSASCSEVCNWYGQATFPLCKISTSGFNFENGTTCVARATCLNQAPGYGGIINSCGQSSSSAKSSSSIKSSSSTPTTSTSASSSSKSSSPSSSSQQATSSSSRVTNSSSSINHAPVAVITGGTRFNPCCSVNLSAADSTDEDGDTLTYTWTVTDCGTFTSTSCNRSSASSSGYTVSGATLAYNTPADDSSQVVLTVTDGRGGVSTATRFFSYIVETSSASSSSSAPSGAQCTYVVSNEWNTGFTALIRITNKGTTAINSWNVNWSYSDGTKLMGSWNATVTGSNPYAASNLSWNNLIQPGQSVEFGLQGNKGTSSNAQIPAVTGGVCK